jgi:hypothetical protein
VFCRIQDSPSPRPKIYIYSLYIYTNAPNRIQLRVTIFWVIRVSRSGKITFNSCFAVYRIHFRRARRSIYIYYIYLPTRPKNLPLITNLLLIQSRLQYIGYIYLIFYYDHIPRLPFYIYSSNISACDTHKDCFDSNKVTLPKLQVLTQF